MKTTTIITITLLSLFLLGCSTFFDDGKTLYAGPTTEFFCDFLTDSCGFNGGTVVTAKALYNGSSNGGSLMSGHEYACLECNVSFMANFSNQTGSNNWKAYYAVNNQTTGQERYYCEDSTATTMVCKPEPTYDFSSPAITPGLWYKFNIFLNWSNSTPYSHLTIFYQNGTLLYNAAKDEQITDLGTNRFFSLNVGTYTTHFYLTNYTIIDTLGTGSSGGSGGSTSGSINISLNTPLNGSTVTVNYVSLNVTVWNNNAT